MRTAAPKSCVYRGWVEHRRYAPRPHRFRYSVFHLYLDLAELDHVFSGMRLWSVERRNVASFRRADHFGDPGVPLERAVRDLVEKKLGTRPEGPIRLLTHLRYFGYVMNPVSFYYCYDRGDQHVETIVAEINNTPWSETHCYVLGDDPNLDSDRRHYRFTKDFHVSPFMGMDLVYDWYFRVPGERLTVHMKNLETGPDGRENLLFDATMSLHRRPLDAAELRRALLHYPFMTGKVVTAIYWQALRLWLRKTPFFPHPRSPRSGSTG